MTARLRTYWDDHCQVCGVADPRCAGEWPCPACERRILASIHDHTLEDEHAE